MNSIVSSNTLQVQGTNDNSIVSKLSMVNAGYHDDPFLRSFVKKPQKRSSLINRGYFVRTKIVQYAVRKFLKQVNGTKQLISLGAGYDTTYFQMKNLCPNEDLLFIEIDFPDVISNKINLARSSGLLVNVNQSKSSDSVSVFRSENYLAIGFDLRNVGKELTNILLENKVCFDTNTLFLSEVVLTYLTASQSSRVLKWICHTFANALTVIFEQMLSHDSFGVVMCRHFEKIGSPLSSIHRFPTLSSQIRRHRELGFNVCSWTDLFSFFNILSINEQLRIERLELFDEYEGWHQMCMHYFALCSSNSSSSELRRFCSELFEKTDPELSNSPKNESPLVETTTTNDLNIPLQLLGHSSCIYEDNRKLLVFGGFGIPNFKQTFSSTSHQRLSSVSVVELNSGHIQKSFPLSIKEVLFGSCLPHATEGPNAFLIFGGRASPNRPSDRLRIVRLGEDSAQVEEVSTRGALSPSARWRHTSTLVPAGDNPPKMIVIGGRDEKRVFGDCWSLDLHTMTWIPLDVHGFKARHSHSTALWSGQNKVVVTGGLDVYSRPLNDVSLLNADGKLECLNIHPNLTARHSHTSHIVQDRMLVLVGGVFFPSSLHLASSPLALQDRIDIVDLNNSTWCRQVNIQPSLPWPIRLHGHTSFIRKTGGGEFELMVFGGGSNCFSFGTAFTKSSFTVLFSL